MYPVGCVFFDGLFNLDMQQNSYTLFSFFTLSFVLLSLFRLSAQDTTNIQHGTASYYSDVLEGRKTANGEIFSQKKLTAAHRTLPFNTLVKVTNLKNDSSVIVRINDRGPYAKNRIIDLSKAAAKELDMLDNGVAQVKVEVIDAYIDADKEHKERKGCLW